MAALFDERVEKAIQIIWFDMHSGRREEALAMLREAANMGDGDAYYFLGRCYLGKSYVDPVVGMPEDKKFAYECFDMSLNLESAVGMFGTMHQDGYQPPRGTCVLPPYRSKRELWDVIAKKADDGQVFCKFLIANAYYYCTAGDFLDVSAETVGIKKLERFRYEWTAMAVRLYEECVSCGLGIAIPIWLIFSATADTAHPSSGRKRGTIFIKAPIWVSGLTSAWSETSTAMTASLQKLSSSMSAQCPTMTSTPATVSENCTPLTACCRLTSKKHCSIWKKATLSFRMMSISVTCWGKFTFAAGTESHVTMRRLFYC